MVVLEITGQKIKIKLKGGNPMATETKKNSLDEKFKNDKLKFEQVKNKDLICKDCRKKYDDTELPCNTSKCKAFNVKPNEIFNGGDCIEYESEK